jgi:hypothetical protein
MLAIVHVAAWTVAFWVALYSMYSSFFDAGWWHFCLVLVAVAITVGAVIRIYSRRSDHD